MALQLMIKKPPGSLKGFPGSLIGSIVDQGLFSVADNSELRKFGLQETVQTSLAVSIDEVIFRLKEAGKISSAQHWVLYSSKHPLDKFLFFDLEEVEIIY